MEFIAAINKLRKYYFYIFIDYDKKLYYTVNNYLSPNKIHDGLHYDPANKILRITGEGFRMDNDKFIIIDNKRVRGLSVDEYPVHVMLKCAITGEKLPHENYTYQNYVSFKNDVAKRKKGIIIKTCSQCLTPSIICNIDGKFIGKFKKFDHVKQELATLGRYSNHPFCYGITDNYYFIKSIKYASKNFVCNSCERAKLYRSD